jgi:hypothetical protein
VSFTILLYLDGFSALGLHWLDEGSTVHRIARHKIMTMANFHAWLTMMLVILAISDSVKLDRALTRERIVKNMCNPLHPHQFL